RDHIRLLERPRQPRCIAPVLIFPWQIGQFLVDRGQAGLEMDLRHPGVFLSVTLNTWVEGEEKTRIESLCESGERSGNGLTTRLDCRSRVLSFSRCKVRYVD